MNFLLNLIEFLKKRKALIASICILLVLGIGGAFVYQMRYTTFQEAFSEILNSDTDVREISISLYGSYDEYPEIEARTTIDNEETLEAIVNDLIDLELKIEPDSFRHDWDYTIVITANNQIREGHSVTDSLYLNIDENYINGYEVVDDTNHLKTVKSLVESEEVEWDVDIN